MLKEAKTISNLGYEVTVIWCPISPWADDFDETLFSEYHKIKWIQAGYHYKKQKYLYWYARLRQKWWQLFFNIIGDKFNAGVKSFVLFSQELTYEALKKKADIFIGHNLGALPAIVKASKKFNSKTIFDFEDFHRGEVEEGYSQYQIVIKLENKNVPFVDYFTAASPEIAVFYGGLYPCIKIQTIYNVFPIEYGLSELKELPTSPLKLFWFSQYVGKNRGIETIIEAMAQLPNYHIILTLLGTATKEIKNYFYSLLIEKGLEKGRLVFIDPVPENEIVTIASMHHIGMASEVVHNTNRDLCLTNKIFIYLLAGNAVLFSNTNAQKNFLESSPEIGFIYEQNSSEDLSTRLYKYFENSFLLSLHRKNAIKLAQSKFNWDVQKNIFQDLLKNVFS